MAVHPGFLNNDALQDNIYIPGITPGAGAYDAPDNQYAAERVTFIVDETSGPSTNNLPIPINTNAHLGYLAEGIGGLWWDRVHVLPRFIALGNIVATVDTVIDVFNAHRTAARTWSAFVNGAGPGTDLLGESLPEIFDLLEGRLFTFRVTTEGPAQVDDILEYTINTQGIIEQPISFTRVVVFPFQPEAPFIEDLEWLTNILECNDGTEQRISLREYPRQTFGFRLQRADGPERQRLENRIFDRQDLPWAVPVWSEPIVLRLAAAVLDTVLTFQTTMYADFRVGGSLILWSGEGDGSYETALIDAITPTTITINTGLADVWPAGTVVMPLRISIMMSNVQNQRHSKNLSIYDMLFRVTDNEVFLAQSNFWAMHDSKVLLDDFNFISGTVAETNEIPITVIDNSTGTITQVSRAQEVSRRSSVKTFVTKNRAELFRVRQLLYALRGRQVSFYLPTFAQEFTVTQPILNGTSTVIVANTGYTAFARQRANRNVLRLVKTDGTKIIRLITGSAVIDDDEETLTVGVAWPSNIALADIEFVDILEKVRLVDDRVRLIHTIPGRARVPLPVKVVLD